MKPSLFAKSASNQIKWWCSDGEWQKERGTLPEAAEKVSVRRAVTLSRGVASEKALREEHVDFSREQKDSESIER